MSDVELLCKAIDAGDLTALGPLADAMEEAGDPRAAGMRKVASFRRTWTNDTGYSPTVYVDSDVIGWWKQAGRTSGLPDLSRPVVSQEVFHAIPGEVKGHPYFSGEWKLFPCRSAAYLALATALSLSLVEA